MRFDAYRLFGWLIPGLCMVFAVLVLFNQTGALKEAQRVRDEASLDVTAAALKKTEVDAQVDERRFAAADANDMEQTLFLTDLRKRVNQSGAEITNWTSQVAQYRDPTTAASTGNTAVAADPKDAALLTNITRVSSTLTLSGPYGAIRSFLEGIQRSDRLFTLSNVNWSRSPENTKLILTISRYVAPPRAKPPTSAPNPATDLGTKQ